MPVATLPVGQLVGTITPATTSYAEYASDPFQVTTGTHTLEIRGTTTTAAAALVDRLRIVPLSSPPERSIVPGLAASRVTWTVHDGANPYADFDGAGTLQTRYLHGPAVDWLLARTSATGDTAWYLTDRLGSVRDLADADGDLINHVAYDSFGRVVSESNPAAGDRFQFTGRELDDATGFQYHRARYYDAAIGRWTQQDPIGFNAGDANLYRYVGNGPTNNSDVYGLKNDDWMGRIWTAGSTLAQGATTPGQLMPDLMEARTVWSNASYMPWYQRTYVTAGTSFGTICGVRGISDAFHRHDAVDGHEQSSLEKAIDGGTGVVALVGTAFGIKASVPGLNNIGRQTSATSSALTRSTQASDDVTGLANNADDCIVTPNNISSQITDQISWPGQRLAGQIDSIAEGAESLSNTLRGATATPKGFIHRKPGGLPSANREFDALVRNRSTIEPLPGSLDGRLARIGKGHRDLPEGTIVNVRPKSSLGADRSGGQPTIEVLFPDGRQVKIRYD